MKKATGKQRGLEGQLTGLIACIFNQSAAQACFTSVIERINLGESLDLSTLSDLLDRHLKATVLREAGSDGLWPPVGSSLAFGGLKSKTKAIAGYTVVGRGCQGCRVAKNNS